MGGFRVGGPTIWRVGGRGGGGVRGERGLTLIGPYSEKKGKNGPYFRDDLVLHCHTDTIILRSVTMCYISEPFYSQRLRTPDVASFIGASHEV